MSLREDLLAKAARAIRDTPEFRVATSFGVPATAQESFSAILAEAVLDAVYYDVYDKGYTQGYEEKYHDVYGEGYDDGYRDGRDR